MLDAVVALHAEAHPGLPHPAGDPYVAIEGGALVGYVIHSVINGASVAAIAVAPEARGRGLARELQRERLRIGREAGCKLAVCVTSPSNAPMLHMLRTSGWTELPMIGGDVPFYFRYPEK